MGRDVLGTDAVAMTAGSVIDVGSPIAVGAAFFNFPGIGAVALADGSFVVAYPSPSGSQVLAQHYAADGTPIGAGVPVNPTSQQASGATLLALTGGGFLVAY